jgi:cytochrome P450
MQDLATLNHIRDLPGFPERTEDMDDHGFLAASRDIGPVLRDMYGFIHTFSHKHFEMLLDDRLTRQLETETLDMLGIGQGAIRDFFANTVLLSNGEVHARRRAPLARTFAFPPVKAMRGDIRRAAEEVIAPLIGREDVAFIDEVAGPIPARIISGILGVPFEDIPHFTKLVYSASRVLTVRSKEVLDEAADDLAALGEYVRDLLASRRRVARDDFLTDFLNRTSDGSLSEDEIRVQVVSLILAGSDTTRSSLTLSFARLLQFGENWGRLVGDPEAWKGGAVEEGLRFDPVVGCLSRVAITDFDLEGTRIPTGSVLAMSMLTAMRDPMVYDRPDQFDITRRDHPRLHPAFGGGVHRCLGEALARIEMEETLGALARLAPGATLRGPGPSMRGLTGIRGIRGMTVALNP